MALRIREGQNTETREVEWALSTLRQGPAVVVRQLQEGQAATLLLFKSVELVELLCRALSERVHPSFMQLVVVELIEMEPGP
jgi:hypothetical protein